MNLVAVGPHAEWLTRSTIDDDPWGPASPLARIVQAAGTVLLLGAPLDTVTLIHHAERIAVAKPNAGCRTTCRCARTPAPDGIGVLELLDTHPDLAGRDIVTLPYLTRCTRVRRS